MKKMSMILLVCLFLSPVVFAQDFFKILRTGTADQVQAAIAAGAKVNDMGAVGITPLMFAAKYTQDPDVIAVLLKAGASLTDKNRENQTPIMFAALNENPKVIATMIDGGAKANDRSPYVLPAGSCDVPAPDARASSRLFRLHDPGFGVNLLGFRPVRRAE